MTASDFSQGNKLLRSNQLEEAVAAYQKAIALHPPFPWISVIRARVVVGGLWCNAIASSNLPDRFN